ncbi:hypothetical protein NBRC111894_3675 [Sporolactobacillus inulinus]|uniref:Diaminopimelate epimerase n=1 Tax=Sporolactobacillus inulinus TaxID=2078 RepID=A0A4Y1ZGP6_9BACL|nr:hypothetical protein [Sporolactobacillus inulinus]GAY78121.1 hypothetical protein NBRC111894_3675 [Sporolactobacillus inulinus]
MDDDQSFFIIDSHTMGEPTRIIMNGFPEVVGGHDYGKENLSAKEL